MEENRQVEQHSPSNNQLISASYSSNNSLTNRNFFPTYPQSNYSMYNNGYASSSFTYPGSNLYRNPSTNSNQYLRPNSQGQENIPIPTPTFKQDIWGSLHGFQALLSVIYAGTGIVHFGKVFLRMSLKLLKAVCEKSMTVILKLTGFDYLKQLLKRLTTDGSWLREFDRERNALESVWGTTRTSSQTLSGKILLVLRVVSLFGALVSLFLHKREKNKQSKQEREQVEMSDQHLGLISFDEKTEDEQEIKWTAFEEGEENEEQETISQKAVETIKVEMNSDVNTEINLAQGSMVKETFKPQIVAEDFWKNKEVFETIQEERSKKTEFVLPSVLQNLKRSATSTPKPWLSKNKNTSEVQNQPHEERKNLNMLTLDAITPVETDAGYQAV